MTDEPCPFCEILAFRAPAVHRYLWDDAIAIAPIGPVAEDHTLIIPRQHVADFTTDPEVTALTARRASEFARRYDMTVANLITSAGAAATQSVFHLHIHLVPRRDNDGLALPWYSGKRKKET